MPATASDYFAKASPGWSGQISAAGVPDATSTSIPLVSTTGLPTDTPVFLMIDRVDNNSAPRAVQFREVIKGVVSGNNIDCGSSANRGVEFTAQGHSAGAVVEFIATAAQFNDYVSGILVEHGQDGKHTKVNGNTVTAGTDTVTLNAASQTLTNKTLTSPIINTPKITKRIVTAADATSITPNTDSADITYQACTQGAGTLTINADTGTPTNGQLWELWVKCTNAQTPSFNAQYVAMGTSLPTSFPAGKNVKMIFQWDSGTSKWGLLAANTEV